MGFFSLALVGGFLLPQAKGVPTLLFFFFVVEPVFASVY